MQKNGQIDAAVKFIEKNLSDELNPEAVAKTHFFSVSQLYRDFYSYTGHSVKEYIRKRRISNACERLKCSELPLDVIAAGSGYQTQQAFHKQFKGLVGLTPIEYRKSDTWFYFYPFAANEVNFAVKVGAETIPECAVTHYYDSRLSGIEDRAVASLGEIKGRVFGRNGKQIGNRFCYELMTEKTDGAGKISEKSGTYAVCAVNYNEREIGDGWNYLYNVWLSSSMFEQAEEGYFEEYLFKDGKPHRLKLYLPVKKRGTARHIAIVQEPEKAFLIAREAGKDAERRASEKVMGFLQERHPLLVRNARRFYVRICISAYGDFCECGVECGGALHLSENGRLELLRIPAGTYAALPDGCLGDISVGAAKLERWLKNNGVAHHNEPVFAVYEAKDGRYDADSVEMTLFKRLKNNENDKNG